MTRAALTVLFLLAALVIAAPRPAQTEIPAASLSVGRTQGVGEPDPSARTGVPYTSAGVSTPESSKGHTEPTATGGLLTGALWQASSDTVRSPSPSSGRHSPRPTSSLPGPSASSGKPATIAHKAPRSHATASKAPKRVIVRQPASGYALTGTASYYCDPPRSICTVGFPASGAFAAAGPRLRAALGPAWRGREVTVTAAGASVTLRLIDWCRCDSGYLLDLYGSVFSQLARNGLSQGVVDVTVTW